LHQIHEQENRIFHGFIDRMEKRVMFFRQRKGKPMLNSANSHKKTREYAKVDLMLQDLEAYLDGRPVAPRSDTLERITSRAKRLRTMEIGLLCLANLSLGLCIGLQAAASSWLPEHATALLVGFSALALVPVIHTLARGSRIED
jgi:hypothetical protein